MRAFCRAILAVTCFALLLPSMGAQRVPVVFSHDLSPHWFDTATPGYPIYPARGAVLAAGEISLGEQGIADMTHARMRLPNGAALPLQIEQSSLVNDLGSLVYFRYVVNIPTEFAASDGCCIELGNDITAPNTLIAGIVLDATHHTAYREILPAPAPAATAGGTEQKQTTVTVIADRKVHHAQLLYLLPILLVLIAALAQWCGRFVKSGVR